MDSIERNSNEFPSVLHLSSTLLWRTSVSYGSEYDIFTAWSWELVNTIVQGRHRGVLFISAVYDAIFSLNILEANTLPALIEQTCVTEMIHYGTHYRIDLFTSALVFIFPAIVLRWCNWSYDMEKKKNVFVIKLKATGAHPRHFAWLPCWAPGKQRLALFELELLMALPLWSKDPALAVSQLFRPIDLLTALLRYKSHLRYNHEPVV